MPGRVFGFAVLVGVVVLVGARFVAGLSVAVAALLRYRDRAWDDDGWSSV